jgi:hypothetical protein
MVAGNESRALFFLLFQKEKNWVARVMGNETFYGDGLCSIPTLLYLVLAQNQKKISSKKKKCQVLTSKFIGFLVS